MNWSKNKDRDRKIVELYQELENSRLVGERLGVSGATVLWVLSREGVRTNRTAWNKGGESAKNKELVLRMEQEGCSLGEIARKIGAKAESVKKFLRANGVTRDFPKATRGPKHHAYKGRGVDKDGYVWVQAPDHPHCRKDGRMLEHRLVMEKMIGRLLEPGEVVHHQDKVKDHNHPSNLELFASNGAHLAHELAGQCPQWSEEGKERIREGMIRRWSRLRESNQTGQEGDAPQCK